MCCSWQANSGWKAWEVSAAQELKEMTKLRTSGKELRTRWRCFVPDTCLWGPLYQQPEHAVSCHPWKLLLVASPTKSSMKPYITVYHSESRHHKPWWKSSKKAGCYTCTDLPLFVNFNSEPKIALPDTKTVKSECFQTKGQRGVSHENGFHLKRQLLQAANWCNEIWKNRGPHWPIEQVYQFHALSKVQTSQHRNSCFLLHLLSRLNFSMSGMPSIKLFSRSPESKDGLQQLQLPQAPCCRAGFLRLCHHHRLGGEHRWGHHLGGETCYQLDKRYTDKHTVGVTDWRQMLQGLSVVGSPG